MSEQPYTWRTWVTYCVSFTVAYFTALWAAVQCFDQEFRAAWDAVIPYHHRLIAGFATAPIVTAILGSLAASLTAMSFVGLGRERMRPLRFFLGGLLSVLGTNWFVLYAVYYLAMPRETGVRWLRIIGIDRFNGTLLLAVPALAFLCAVVAVVVVESIAVAQRT
jgi:hypothetical protein